VAQRKVVKSSQRKAVGALGRDPSPVRTTVTRKADPKKADPRKADPKKVVTTGALSTDPSAAATGDINGLQAQRKQIQAQLNKNPNDARARKKLDGIRKQIQTIQRNPQTPPPDVSTQTPAAPTGEPQATYETTVQDANNVTGGIFDQIQGQGSFDPAAYQAAFKQQQEQAYNSVMDRFNRSMQPQFDREAENFKQMASERGWDPTSKDFSEAYQQQVVDPQNSARANAMDQAYQTGMAAQQQGFNQSSSASLDIA